MNREPLWTKDFILISFANFFLVLTFYSLLVTMPTIAIQNYGVSESLAGLYTSGFLIAAIISRFFTGTLITKFSKRSVFIVSFLMYAILQFVYSFSDHYLFILVIRFIQGLGFGLATALPSAIISDIIPQTRKGEGMGYFVTSANLAMVLGPFIGLTVINHFEPNHLFWVLSVSAVIAMILSTMAKTNEEELEEGTATKKNEQTFIEKRALPVSITIMYLGIAYAAVTSFVAVFAVQNGMEHVSSYFFSVFAVILILTRPFSGRWFDFYGPNFVIFPAILFLAAGMFTLGMSKTAFIFLLSAGLIGIGWGTLFSSLQTLAIQSTTPKRAPIATSTYLNLLDFGVSIGAFFTGVISRKIELGHLFIYFSFYLLLGIVVYFFAQKNHPQTKRKQVMSEKNIV